MQIETKLMKLATIQMTLEAMATCLNRITTDDGTIEADQNQLPSEWAITGAVNDLQSIISATEQEHKDGADNLMYGLCCEAIGHLEAGKTEEASRCMFDLADRLIQ
ncbi:MAG: hypothetical protein WCP20_10055 [Desulfuromonadales bacterium]